MGHTLEIWSRSSFPKVGTIFFKMGFSRLNHLFLVLRTIFRKIFFSLECWKSKKLRPLDLRIFYEFLIQVVRPLWMKQEKNMRIHFHYHSTTALLKNKTKVSQFKTSIYLFIYLIRYSIKRTVLRVIYID